jgi:hypothetical protein
MTSLNAAPALQLNVLSTLSSYNDFTTEVTSKTLDVVPNCSSVNLLFKSTDCAPS